MAPAVRQSNYLRFLSAVTQKEAYSPFEFNKSSKSAATMHNL